MVNGEIIWPNQTPGRRIIRKIQLDFGQFKVPESPSPKSTEIVTRSPPFSEKVRRLQASSAKSPAKEVTHYFILHYIITILRPYNIVASRMLRSNTFLFYFHFLLSLSLLDVHVGYNVNKVQGFSINMHFEMQLLILMHEMERNEL